MRPTAWLAGLGLALALASPAAATRQVALVMKDPSAPAQAVTQEQLKALADQLWAHGIEVVDVSKGKDAGEVSRAMPDFMGKLSGSEVAVLYYVGVARTGSDNRTVVFSRQGQGQGEAPPTVQELLERMKESKRSVAVLDILKRRGDNRANEHAGLSGIVPAGNQLIAFANTFDDRTAGGLPLTASFLRHLGAVEQQPMPLVKLASLVKEDVTIETGGLHVPWVLGNLEGGTRLQRMDDGEVRRRQLAALDELLDQRKCAGANPDQRLQAGLVEYRKTKPTAPQAPLQLAAVDIYDMLWLLRVNPADCFGRGGVFTGPLPPAVRTPAPPVARVPAPPRAQPRTAAVPPPAAARPPRFEQGPRIEQAPRAERQVPRRSVESAPPREQRSAPAVSRGGGGFGGGGGGGGGGRSVGGGGGGSYAPPPI